MTKTSKFALLLALFCGLAFGQTCSVVSAANYGITTPWIAPDSLVTIFAPNMATGTYSVSNQTTDTLPMVLGGVSATITVSGEALPLSFIAVSPNQANAVLPNFTVSNPTAPSTTITLISGMGGVPITCNAQVEPISASLFSVDESGTWLAAAQVIIVHADGSQTEPVPVAQYSSTPVLTWIPWGDLASDQGTTKLTNWLPFPIDLGNSTDTAILELFGTGFRNASMNNIEADICYSPGNPLFGDASRENCAIVNNVGSHPVDVTVAYAGAQNGFYGLDQINVVLPRVLVGAGLMDVFIDAAVHLTCESSPCTIGNGSNTVNVSIK